MKLKPFHPLSQGLLMSFLLNEAGGNILYDATGNQNHGTGTNIAWGADGLDLPGVNEHVSIPNFIAQDDDWTIFIGFTQDTRNPTAQASNSKLVAMQDGTAGAGRSILYINDKPGTPTYKLATYIDSSTNLADTVIEVGKAYTAGLTQEGTSFHFYLNGVDDGSFVGTAAAANGNIILFDHKLVAGVGCFDGTSEVIHWYNRPLSAAEMMWLDYDPWGMFEPDFTPFIFEGATVRELSTTIAASTTTTAQLKILREFISTLSANAATSTISFGVLRVLETIVAASTVTGTPPITVLREMESIIASSSTTSAQLKILRELSAIAAATTSLSALSLNLAGIETENKRRSAMSLPWHVLYPVPDGHIGTADRRHVMGYYRGVGAATFELSTVIDATTELSQIDLATLREIATTVAASTTSSVAELQILREIASVLAAQTGSTAAIRVLREIDSTIAIITSMSASELNILREVASTIAASTAATSDLSILREILATLSATTSTSVPPFNVQRNFTSAIAATTASSATIDIIRELASAISAQTALSQIELIIAALRELSTTVAVTTSTSASELKVLREMSVVMEAQSASAASANVLRELETIVAAGTSLSQIELIIGALIELSATIASTTSTSAANFNVVRAFTTIVSATTSASDITILMVRAMSAQIAAGTDVGAATLLVMREFSTSVDAETFTSAIELLIAMVPHIIDTEVQSLTPKRMILPT